jgi:pimeloyl-ACP methyl ester carboxylesterase
VGRKATGLNLGGQDMAAGLPSGYSTYQKIWMRVGSCEVRSSKLIGRYFMLTHELRYLRNGKLHTCCNTIGLFFLILLFFNVLWMPKLAGTAIAMEYGETGPYSIERHTFENSLWKKINGGVEVSVLLPQQISGRVPVVFFSHGYGGTSWLGYRSLLTHMASRGIAVVFSPYPVSGTNDQRYSILWNGFEEAVSRFKTRIDITKVGFSGHSYGGGSTPAMAYKGLVERGWGNNGAFMYIMAPFYTFTVSDSQLKLLPNHTNLIMQVFSNDTITPHRIAMDQYTKMSSFSFERKAYYFTEGGHNEPSDISINDLDKFAIRKPLDALIDYSFKIDKPEEGRITALTIGKPGDNYLTIVLKDPSISWDDPINQPSFSWDDSSNQPSYEDVVDETRLFRRWLIKRWGLQ